MPNGACPSATHGCCGQCRCWRDSRQDSPGIVILRKRQSFRAAFADLDRVKVAAFDDRDIARLMDGPGILRACAKMKPR